MDPKRRALRPIAAHTRYGDAGALPVNLPMKTESEKGWSNLIKGIHGFLLRHPLSTIIIKLADSEMVAADSAQYSSKVAWCLPGFGKGPIRDRGRMTSGREFRMAEVSASLR
jgi:hypothetical protein